MNISVVIPVYNEGESVFPLYSELNEVLSSCGKTHEIIFVNDGSTDHTFENLKNIHSKNQSVRIINLNKTFGQTAAILAGFHLAKGDIIVTMDGDLQNDPHDIPNMLKEIDNGFDIVSGWRKKRKDNILRVIPSILANRLISSFLGLRLHDYGCTLKAFRKNIVKDINLYGEMHRFIPAVASWSGAKIKEIEVNHRTRKHGKSKYGYSRIIKVLLDLVVMIFLSEFRTKPIRFFGGIALINLFLGMLSFVGLIYMKFFNGVDMTGNPLIILTVLFILVSVQLISIGLIGEINIRTYYESQDKKTYHIKEIIG